MITKVNSSQIIYNFALLNNNTTPTRLSQLEDDVSQLTTVGGDVKHLKADNEATKEDLNSRITSLETNDRRRDGNERSLRRLETKQRDIEEKLIRVPTPEGIDRDMRRLTQDFDGKYQTLETKVATGKVRSYFYFLSTFFAQIKKKQSVKIISEDRFHYFFQ